VSCDTSYPGTMARLHVVTGKGGTGKTTVAAAMALSLADEGKRVLLCEVEGRQGLAQLFDVPPLPYVERRIAQGPGGGEVFALAVDAEAALLEYLDMYYHLGRAGKALEKVGAIDFVTTIAPGLRDVLLTGKVYEATRRKAHGRLAYDAVVLDAPPTGRIGRFLNVNHEVAGLAKVGPIRNQADAIMGMLRSDVTRVHLVTLLEEMPVQETLDAVEQLEKIDLRIGSIVVNMVRNSPLDDDALALAVKEKLPAAELTRGLKAAGITIGPDLVKTLAGEAHDHAIRVGLERENRDRIDALGKKVVELELQPEGIDHGALFDLAEELRA
jgi:anion-transporting  ArsA/GET3 family ATPase